MDQQTTFKVLSIDGGGIRGIIPAMILDYIEKQTFTQTHESISRMPGDQAQKNKLYAELSSVAVEDSIPTAKLFNLIAGTSTGGILALALTKPKEEDNLEPAYTAEKLVKLYKKEGSVIFDQSLRAQWTSGEDVLDRFQRIVFRRIAEAKYPASGIKQVLYKYFQDTYLSRALTDVLIPAYDMQGTRAYWNATRSTDSSTQAERVGGHPRFFKSHQAKNPCCPEEDYPMRVVAHATSAAPTYFDPVDTPFGRSDESSLSETLVDGGIFANNPAMCAYAEAMRIQEEEEWPEGTRTLILSLGTGQLTEDLKAADAEGWGQVRWLMPIFTMILDGASDTVDYQLKQLPNVCPYYRFQPILREEGMGGMDDADDKHLSKLKTAAKCFIDTEKTKLNKLCCQLSGEMLGQLKTDAS